MRYLCCLLLLVTVGICFADDYETRDLDLPVHPSITLAPLPKTPVPAQNNQPGVPSVVPPTTTPLVPPIPPTPEPQDDPKDEPAPVFFGEEITTETGTLIYVIDVSGSMGDWLVPPRHEWVPIRPGSVQGSLLAIPGTGVSRLDVAKREINRSIAGLSPNISFDIVAYDCNTFLWQPALVSADDPHKAAATQWVNRLMPGGYTGTAQAVVTALAVRENNVVVLLTDGEPYECPRFRDPDWHRETINNFNKRRDIPATINVFGIEANADMRRFCRGVAADSGGGYFDVSTNP